MAKAPKEYSRLPGRGVRGSGFRLFSSSRAVCTLWMGRDHLLLVDRTGYTESYKRFYFADIQAIVIRRTSSATTTIAVTGSLALGIFAWAFSISDMAGRITLFILGGLFALIALHGLWLGPSCVTHIQTAVQTDQLAAWNRIRAARKGLAVLRPKLQETQGTVPPEELRLQMMTQISGQTDGTSSAPT
ncbi:MAG TPA: hypothetical protein VGO67_13985 [Verrucomicrobiae bacterium]|jgi:hypothetical protein